MRILWGALACLAMSGLWGCGSPSGETGPAPVSDPGTLLILAGSEVRPLEADIVRAGKAAGVTVQMRYSGTIDMVDRINAGEPFDAILPPNGAYPQLALTSKPAAREKLFYSRVALGVRQSKAHALGWDRNPPSWKEITEQVRLGQLRYAMTNPTSSNTGMSALFAVAASLADKTDDLRTTDIQTQGLKDFLRGQQLTAGSSEWLADAFLAQGSTQPLDALVNYEAVLLRLNDRLPGEKLTLLYPREGVISADYPLMLLHPQKQAAYDRLVAALKAPAFQAGPVARAYLRPLDATTARSPLLSNAVVVELSFPNDLAVIDAVLSAYQAELRRPATSLYVLDISGSMNGERLSQLKAALEQLTDVDAQTAHHRYERFQPRERVVLIPFSDVVEPPVRFSFEGDAAQTRAQLHGYIGQLHTRGGTAIYSALLTALEIARTEAQDPGRVVTIVLLTDGENNAGSTADAFQEQVLHVSDSAPIRVFPILFGEASPPELEQIAHLTGGRTFEGWGQLQGALREIRGYQ